MTGTSTLVSVQSESINVIVTKKTNYLKEHGITTPQNATLLTICIMKKYWILAVGPTMKTKHAPNVPIVTPNGSQRTGTTSLNRQTKLMKHIPCPAPVLVMESHLMKIFWTIGTTYGLNNINNVGEM
mmetsp:Transcript_6184/g.9015  ORF Transcript_6184/g.9015 Transcript_6184/m.9015 type:complete len:127 (-) Transcript_6184:38-418(-)